MGTEGIGRQWIIIVIKKCGGRNLWRRGSVQKWLAMVTVGGAQGGNGDPRRGVRPEGGFGAQRAGVLEGARDVKKRVWLCVGISSPDAGEAVVCRGEGRGVSVGDETRDDGGATLRGFAKLVNDVGIGSGRGGGVGGGCAGLRHGGKKGKGEKNFFSAR